MGEAGVTDFLKAAWQHVLQEPAQELFGADCHRLVRIGTAGANRERNEPLGKRAAFPLSRGGS
jgi:hypothetical protein